MATPLAALKNTAYFANVTLSTYYGLIIFSRLGPLEAVAIVTGLIGLLLHRQSQNWLILWFFLVMWLSLFFPTKPLYHIVEVYPMFALIMAAGNMALGRTLAAYSPKWKKLFVLLSWALCSMVLIAYMVAGISIGYRSQPASYESAYRQVRSLVPAQSSVLGDFRWWWALYDESFTADYYLNVIFFEQPDVSASLRRVLQERQIDVILLDEAGHIPEMGIEGFRDVLGAYIRQNCYLAGSVRYTIGVEYGGPIPRTTQVFICSR